MRQWLSFHQEGYFIFKFYLRVAVERRNLHLVQRHHSVADISDYSSQWELITITKRQKWRTFLLGDSDRLRSPYCQRCAAHSSVNFITIFSTKKAVSILERGKRRRTRTTYSSSGTQLYMIAIATTVDASSTQCHHWKTVVRAPSTKCRQRSVVAEMSTIWYAALHLPKK